MKILFPKDWDSSDISSTIRCSCKSLRLADSRRTHSIWKSSLCDLRRNPNAQHWLERCRRYCTEAAPSGDWLLSPKAKASVPPSHFSIKSSRGVLWQKDNYKKYFDLYIFVETLLTQAVIFLLFCLSMHMKVPPPWFWRKLNNHW